MIYRLIKNLDDDDIPIILSAYNQPFVSQFIGIDEENYWKYVTSTDNVYFYKIYNGDKLVGTVHLELDEHFCLCISVVVFSEYQKQGIATTIIKEIQSGKFELDFNVIQVFIDETNIASLKLFEKVGFVCVGKDEELLEYAYRKN